MKTANQLTFTTYEASLKLKPNDPAKIIFDNIDWSFIHRLVNGKYSAQGAVGYDPISLFITWHVRIEDYNLPGYRQDNR